MEKERSFKTMALVALVLSVFGVSVAFAAMSTTLNINGTASMTPAKWDIHFEDLQVTTTGYPKINGTATITGATTIDNIDVTLTSPGDTVVYTFKVVNGGDLNALLDAVNKSTVTCTGSEATATEDQTLVCSNLTYTLTYAEGGEVVRGAALDKNTEVGMVLTLKFADIKEMPTNPVSIDGLNISLNYIQTN